MASTPNKREKRIASLARRLKESRAIIRAVLSRIGFDATDEAVVNELMDGWCPSLKLRGKVICNAK